MKAYFLGKLKIGLGILLMGCLFLPLAQCSQVPQEQEAADTVTVPAQDPKAEIADSTANAATNAGTEPTVKNHYVLQSFSDWLSWLQALSFCAPLLWLLSTTGKLPKVTSASVLLLLAFMAFFVVFRVTFWADRLLVGGYLAYVASGGLIILALLDLVGGLSQTKVIQLSTPD